jgi:H+/gluconate symporter-like permease
MSSQTTMLLLGLMVGLPATITAITGLLIVLKKVDKVDHTVSVVRQEMKENTEITKHTSERTDTLEKQGNSMQETNLRVRKALAERNLADLPDKQANKDEVTNATIALESHLNMQKRVDAMQAQNRSPT